MVDLKAQYLEIKPEIDAAIQSVIDRSAFINGQEVKDFAKNLEDYLGAKHVIPCGNGTDAIQIALMALGLEPGDEVITVPFTFVATAEVIALLQLKPVFVDVNPCTFTLDEYQLEKAITPKTKCIIPVHLFGQISNMEAIMEIANKHNLSVVEDNAQAIGADFTFSDGAVKKAGTIGTIGTTSFFPSKNLGCYGDGGAIFTNDDDLATELRMIINHGSRIKYYHPTIGVNSRLDTMQAAVLDIKLKHLDRYCQSRFEAAQYYNEKLATIGELKTPKIASYSSHVFHQYTLLVEGGKRDALLEHLKKHDIPCAVYYPVPLHMQEAYVKTSGYKEGDMPVSESLAARVLSLPMHSELDRKTQDEILSVIYTFFE